jgi:phage shock protein A
MGFFERIGNLWKGFWSLWISDVENKNPEIVYEQAIEARIKRHRELQKAVGGIVFLRNKIQTELETKERELKEVNAQIPVAVEQNDDEVALILLQKKAELEKSIESLTVELEKVQKQADEAKESLVAFKGEIEKLRRERNEMLAKKATAEARLQIQQTLDGLSTDADIKQLENVREHIHKMQAEADVGSEIRGDSLDARLKKIKEKTGDATARSQLEELKRQSAARSAAAEGVKKTI